MIWYNTMAIKQFDRNEVLEKAVRLFWVNGFYSSSIQQVKEVTGLKPGSLYNEFGSKEGLFSEALKYYAQKNFTYISSVLDEAPSVGEGLCGLFEFLITDSEKNDYCSCFIIKTQLELAAAGNELYKLATEMLINVESLIYRHLQKKYDPELSRTRAACIMIHIFGIRVYGYRRDSIQMQRASLRENLPWLPWCSLNNFN